MINVLACSPFPSHYQPAVARTLTARTYGLPQLLPICISRASLRHSSNFSYEPSLHTCHAPP